MCNAEAARMRRPEGGMPPADTKEVLKLEKKMREMQKIEDRVNAGERVDPLQRQKLGRKAEVEAALVEARNAAVFETTPTTVASTPTTAASQYGLASDGFQETAEYMHSDEPMQCQPDESAQPGWQQAVAVGGQAAMMGGLAPMVQYLVPVQAPQPSWQQLIPWSHQADGACPCWMPQAPVAPLGAGQVLVMLQPAFPQAGPEAAQQPTGPALPHGSGPCPAWQRHHRGKNRTADRVAVVQPDYCDRLLVDLEAGGAARAATLASLVGEVRRLAMDGNGCHVVQRAVEVADSVTAQELVQALHGHVRDLIRSPNGNHVVQKIVEVLPPRLADFVAGELHGCAAEVARHKFGCRVIIRLIEYCPDSLANAWRAALVDELLADVADLCRHPYGQYTIKAVLGHAHPTQRQRVLAFLCTGAADRAQDRFHSYVVEAALDSGTAEQAECLAHALLGDTPANVVLLSQTRWGSNLLRVLLGRTGAASQKALDLLRSAAHQLQHTPCGKRLLKDAGLVTGRSSR